MRNARMEFHEYCKLVPEPSEEDYKRLVADIKANGQNDPISGLCCALKSIRNLHGMGIVAGVAVGNPCHSDARDATGQNRWRMALR